MDPPRKHLKTDDLASLEIHLRLKMRNELSVFEAEADALLDLAVGDQRALHPIIEPDGTRDASRSRMIHGYVGAAENVGDPCIARSGRGNSGKGANLDDAFLEQQWPADGLKDCFG